jgi:hypothetical protein
MFGIASSAEEDVFPRDVQSFVNKKTFQEGGSQAHSRIRYVVFAFYEVLFFLADERECFPGLTFVS